MRNAIVTGLMLSLAACLLGGCGDKEYVPPTGYQTAICGVQVQILPGGEPGTQKVEQSPAGGSVIDGNVKIELKNKSAGTDGSQYDVIVNDKKYGKVVEGQDIVVGEDGSVWVYSQKRQPQ